MNDQLFEWIHRFAGHSHGLDSLMIMLANDIVWVLLAWLVLLWLTGREVNQRLVICAGLTTAAALLGDMLLAPLINHPRPFVALAFRPLIPHAADPSFPSSHATFAFAIAFAVWFVSRRRGTVMLALALLTGAARVYVGVHYPADILGAAALALVCGIAVHLGRNRLDPLLSWIMKLYRKLTVHLPFIPHPD
ncbi:phosphatase PAP2 family protein [Gorillibacterium timonense]|uniref:phosphatase PAP2 family protein n=1 Tax=Gorillibacterium timonense TaxID=1689269 RepID=UPI00071DCE28|nr:phosphatase PAP2 family protein [Gorillibacterium timonense]